VRPEDGDLLTSPFSESSPINIDINGQRGEVLITVMNR
jgi:hypothetical protein